MKTDISYCAIDTNIFLYAHFSDYPCHGLIHAFLQDFINSSQTFYLSWQVYYEYMRVATHPAVLKRPLPAVKAHASFCAYLDLAQCEVLSETALHRQTVSDVIKAFPLVKSNGMHDLHYAAILKENGVKKILTCDSDFKRYDFLEVINPLI